MPDTRAWPPPGTRRGDGGTDEILPPHRWTAPVGGGQRPRPDTEKGRKRYRAVPTSGPSSPVCPGDFCAALVVRLVPGPLRDERSSLGNGEHGPLVYEDRDGTADRGARKPVLLDEV